MTGQLKTSFKQSIAMGCYNPTQTTIPNLINELRLSSGCAGSLSLQTAYTLNGVTIPSNWYNFLYIPHRSGGLNGAESGDNCDYGSLLLSGMTGSGCYIIRYTSKSIAEVRNLYKDTTYSNATASAAGLMSAADKTKLDKIKFRIDKDVSFNNGVVTISDSFITDLNVGVISCLAYLNSAPHLHLVTQVSSTGKFNVYARGANASDQPSSSSKFTIYSLLYRT